MDAVRMVELSDREFYAAMAMQGIISRYAAMAMQGIISRQEWPADEVAKEAVAYADALIQALEAVAPKHRQLR
jgi:hypothetical protein